MGDVGGGQAAPYIALAHGAALARSQLFAPIFRCVQEGQNRCSGEWEGGSGARAPRGEEV